MATMTLGRSTAVVPPTRRSNTLPLTMNDSKILGNYTRKLEKTTPPDKFKTRMLKTHNSNWTPVVHKPSNKQIFKERKDLVSNWFDMWTDSQRKEFLKQIFQQCRRPQYGFIQNWFTDHVPLRHLDFTNVLPRFLSLKIMSYLDPRSLSRASQVCWHWKFLSEQDSVWQQKCARQGWFLPYSPASNEYGAWKQHYLACIKTLDMHVLSKQPNPVYGGIGDGSDKTRKKRILTEKESGEVMSIRQPWLPPDKNPQDLRDSCNALFHELNPNDPKTDTSLLKHHNKWGIPKKSLSFLSMSKSMEELDRNQTKRISSATRKSFHRGLDDDEGLKQTGYRKSLGEYLELTTFEEKRLMELVNQPWEMETNKKKSRTGNYPVPWKQSNTTEHSKSFPNQTHPRIIFISSRVPAADILVDAVLFGVIPIVYEYEETTIQSLESQLETCLSGRSAQSIAFFLHADDPGELKMVHGDSINVNNLDREEYVAFLTNVTSKVLPSTQNGHIDFFVPLASCEPGNEMITQLGILTGMTFTSPTGVIGNYNHVNSEWLKTGESDPPPAQYFCKSKLNVWANTADQVTEACKTTKQVVGRYFQQIHKDVVSQLTGQLLFDAMNVVDIHGVETVTESLVEGLIAMGTTQDKSPLEFLGRFFLEKSGAKLPKTLTTRPKKLGETLAPAVTMEGDALSDHLALSENFDESLQGSEITGDDEEIAELNKVTKEQKNMMMTMKPKSHDDDEEEESIGEEIEEKSDEDEDEEAADKRKVKLLMKPLVEGTTLSDTMYELESTGLSGLPTSRKPKYTTMRITAQELAENPEKRTIIAREIMASELDYVKTLGIVQKIFHNPLKSALASNRAIVSAQHLQVIFTDTLAILDVHRVLLEDLKGKLSTWDTDECLGDVFVRFCSKLKIYTNFLNNYQTILTTIERSMEQSPSFRAFRSQHERTPQSKMLTLPELLLYPARRIGEYVALLNWFHMYTPNDHADRDDLQQAILTLKDLNKIINQCNTRMEREKEIKQIQKKIINCPLLLEANRYFVKQLDVANLKQQNVPGPDGSRLYEHVQILGLFLFNDSLVVTRRTTHNFPFSRAVEFQYKFETCCSLARLRVVDMTDTKYISNTFSMLTPKNTWICKTDTFEEKFNWITLLESRIKTQMS